MLIGDLVYIVLFGSLRGLLLTKDRLHTIIIQQNFEVMEVSHIQYKQKKIMPKFKHFPKVLRAILLVVSFVLLS